MEDFTTFICYQMKGAMKKLEKYMSQRFDEFGINLSQSFILFTLLEKDGATLTEIGNHTQIENSSLTTMVDRLEKEGLAERRLVAEDRRIIRLYITDKGRELAERVLGEGTKFNQQLKDDLVGCEEQFYKGLARISESLDRIK